MAQRKLLVTGAAGFIGSNFVRYWLDKYPNDSVVALDALTYAGHTENLQGLDQEEYTFVEGNICDAQLMATLFREQGIDTVVHFAAESHVDRSISGPDDFIQTNIIGTYTLLEVARKLWLLDGGVKENHRFHHVSTDEVYGTLGPQDPAFSESTAYAPNSPYSASKASSDHLVRAYHHTYGLKTTISNCSNNYGPYHFPEKLIPLLITNVLRNKAIPVYGDGQQIRDWLFVEDHALGIDLVINKGRLGESYNIGGNNEWSNIDIVNKVCACIDKSFQHSPELRRLYPHATNAAVGKSAELITFVEDRPGHDRRYAIDPTKSESELGYVPKFNFEQGIEETVGWFLKNKEWVESVSDIKFS